MARRWATCSPSCNSCSAPIREPAGERGRRDCRGRTGRRDRPPPRLGGRRRGARSRAAMADGCRSRHPARRRDCRGVAVAKLTPTYSGCPAVLIIELAVRRRSRRPALRRASSGSSRPPGPATGSRPRAGPSCGGRHRPAARRGAIRARAVRRDGRRLPALRLPGYRAAVGVRLDRLQGALPLPRLPRAVRPVQVHLSRGRPPLS